MIPLFPGNFHAIQVKRSRNLQHIYGIVKSRFVFFNVSATAPLHATRIMECQLDSRRLRPVSNLDLALIELNWETS